MDARDIKDPVPVIKDGRYLENIYSLQKELIDHYVKIEGLPQYPIDVNTKKSQVIIKDFVGRVIEELAEGYESMILIDELSIKNLSWTYQYNPMEFDQCINHLQNVSEEMADAMHFMTELLIFVNIQPEDILAYIRKETGDKFETLFQTVSNYYDVIDISMRYGAALFTKEMDINNRGIDLLRVQSTDSLKDIQLYQAAHIYNHSFYVQFKEALWDVTYHLNIARNFLKNKPWKQSQMMTDEIRFQAEIVKGFIKMMGAFSLIDITSENLFHIYFKKNRANAFRIRSNY